MDTGSWIGVVSLILALPVGIASIVITPKLVAYLEKPEAFKNASHEGAGPCII
jgi:hypothetical protein